jgi:excisionase family DNA binding protein
MAELSEKPLGIVEAAGFLGLSVNYLHKLCHLGRITFFKPTGGRVYFKREDLEAFVFRGRSGADYELREKADQILNGRRP